MNGQRVLVTGANGFIGASVKRAFEAAGAQVTGVDIRRADGVLDVDLADDSQVKQLFEEGPFDVIAHLAASGVGAAGLLASARLEPLRAVEVNVAGTARLVGHALESGVTRFVYASSTTVYGATRLYGHARISEDAALEPATVYGATKAAAEQIGRCLVADSDLDFVALRLPLVYGAQRWYGGALTPLLEMASALKEGRPATVSLGATPVDWLHVEDAGQAFVSAATASNTALAYHLVGHTGTMLDLAQQVLDLAPGHEVTLEAQPHDPDEAPPLIDDARARQDLGFVPTYADVRAAAQSLVGEQAAS